MTANLELAIMDDNQVDMRDLSMCIERAIGEIKAQGIPDKRRNRLTDIGMISINTVMLSFGLELALKGALQRAGQKPPREHDLKKIHERLPQDDQERIAELWQNELWLSQEAKDMGSLTFFSLHSDDFIKWRYLESPKTDIKDTDLYGAIMIVNEVSFE